MKKNISIVSLIIILLAGFACETPNPFGPVYDSEGNLARDRIIIDEFLLNTPIDSLYRIHDPSGVVVIVQEEGAGIKPVTGNLIFTDFTGSLLDGSVFDTSIESVAIENGIFSENRNYRLFLFTQGGTEAIAGFNLGFRNLKSGSKGILIIPSPFGYRDSEANPRIPPNSVILFEVDFKGLD